MHSVLAQPDIWATAAASLSGIWSVAWPYLMMLLGFSLIVFVHELGHFAVAKWAGVRVERFAVGFGRELFGVTKGETRYSFNVLPLGGYVKMLGQEDFDDKALELKFKDDPGSFANKPVGHRMAIVSAGVIMNILFACLLFMIVFMIGMETMGTRIAYVEADSPADRAGLLPGDEIQRINGERVLGYNEVMMAIMLAPLHEPIDVVVDRDGKRKAFSVKPEYLRPESSRQGRRQIIGIRPGITREIIFVGPEIDESRPDHPHVGDYLVEVNGIEVTDDNASEVRPMLAYTKGDIYVERPDPDNPDAAPKRVKVEMPPMLQLYPSGDGKHGDISVLGLSPLVKFSTVHPRGRARLAGIKEGDTVLNWDDIPYPTQIDIRRAIHESAEWDIPFLVRRQSGELYRGFVRPKANRRGAATIQAICEPIPDDERLLDEPRARFTDVRKLGQADEVGIATGDVILSCGGKQNPTATEVNTAVRTNRGNPVALTVRKQDGTVLSTIVEPRASGSIDASYSLVADDLLRVSEIIPEINGRPSPAARAGLEKGIKITSVNETPVSQWRELIDAFRDNAGTTIKLGYIGTDGEQHIASFDVPHSLRTRLGVGPEAYIVSINGKRYVDVQTGKGTQSVSAGYREGTRTLLTELVGSTHVPVEFRRNPLAEVETDYIDVTEDMVDPWLGRITYASNIEVNAEMKLLKGKNALDAVWIGVHKTYYFIMTVYKMLERMLFTRSVGIENVSGPLGIIDLGGKVARTGFVEFIFFLAIISANLAVINFLPLPIVDGGLMVFLIIEKIKGSPVSLRVQIATQMIGLFLIIGLFVLVTLNDAIRMWG
ncbi:MAG: RIP metalloprotease RseP [Phycisphaerae bacterium]|jgi:membrane-associated protease RseP (regulator of RpoE activity)